MGFIYRRTTQTAKGLYDHAPDVNWDVSIQNGGSIFFDPRLRERSYGYFDGLSDAENAKKYPDQWEHFQKDLREPQGRYYALPYGGESPANVCERLDGFKETLSRDINKGLEHHVIVNHGMTLRCFVSNFFHLHPHFFVQEKNPANTAVRMIDKNQETGRYADYGYIYDVDKGIALQTKPDKPLRYDFNLIPM